MREIKHIVLHCTATSQKATVEAIQRYWREQLGWKNPGYHYLISPSGEIHKLQPEDKSANGVAGHNANSIHVSYIGGIDATGKAIDSRTLNQKIEMYFLVVDLLARYPGSTLMGHRDFPGVKKDCPSFDAKQWFRTHPISLTT
jgi:N-acetylmuramoyl-L-alanine amidase